VVPLTGLSKNAVSATQVHLEPEHTDPPEQVPAPPSDPGQQRSPADPHAQSGAPPASLTSQARPALQVVPLQHASFALPHSHTFSLVHVRLLPHFGPSQQASPAAPHGTQLFPEACATHTLPASHAGLHTRGAASGAASPPELLPSVGPSIPPESPREPSIPLDPPSPGGRTPPSTSTASSGGMAVMSPASFTCDGDAQ
jgi:hypothetical protein